MDVLRNLHIIKYVDDTVLYIAGNNIEIIESLLLVDLNLLAHWFKKNELIFNLKKGKTEAMIFGTAMLNRCLKVKYQHHTAYVTTSIDTWGRYRSLVNFQRLFYDII